MSKPITSTIWMNSRLAICPPWCTAGPEHLHEASAEDVRHTAAEVPGITVADFAGEHWEVLKVGIHADSNAQGQPTRPYAAVTPVASYCDEEELDAEGLRRRAQQLRDHAAALDELAALLQQLSDEDGVQ